MWITVLLDRVAALVNFLAAPWRTSGDRLPRGRRGPMRVVYESAEVHESASWRARFLQRWIRLVVQPLLRIMPVNDRTLGWMRRSDKLSARQARSRYVEPVRFDLGGVPVESTTHLYGPDSDLTILYLHGGGFVSGGIESHRRVCDRLARKSGATVISVDYVQLPDGTVADSVSDAITAYEALLQISAHPEKIVVAGDSAGGYLAMKIAEIATLRGITPPAGVIGFSPLLSLDPHRLDKDVERVVRARDAYLPIGKFTQLRSRWVPEGARIEGEISPLDAADRIVSPAFLVAADDEILRPEVEAMALRLSAHGVEVETHLWRKQVHAFPVFGKALPESELALQLAADFARRVVGELDRVPDRDPQSHDEVMVGEVPPDSAA